MLDAARRVCLLSQQRRACSPLQAPHNEYHQYEDKIFKEWRDLSFIKARQKEIAIKYNFRKEDLSKKFDRTIKNKLLEFYDAKNIKESIKSFFNKTFAFF